MRGWLVGFCLLSAAWAAPEVLLVMGEPGQPEYAEQFEQARADWGAAVSNLVVFGAGTGTGTGTGSDTNAEPDRVLLQRALETRREGSEPLWLILHGHGSFDGRDGRFNLRGPDVTDAELKDWLAGVERETVVVAAFSGGIRFLAALSASNRTVVSATRAVAEDSFSHFGGFLAAAVSDPEGDIDRDGAVSLLEAFLLASRHTAEFYTAEQRILTEHALIDDNGDGRGSPAEVFRGVRAKPVKEGTADGMRARQLHLVPSPADQGMSAEDRARRDLLEREVFALRERKPQMDASAYYRELKALLLQLADLYD